MTSLDDGLHSPLRCGQDQITLTDTKFPSGRQIDVLDASSSSLDVFLIVIYICLSFLVKRTTPSPHSQSFAPAGRHFHPGPPYLNYQPSCSLCAPCHRSHQLVRRPALSWFTHASIISVAFSHRPSILSSFLFRQFQWALVYPMWIQTPLNSMQRLKKPSKRSVILPTLLDRCGKPFCYILSSPPRF